MTRGPLLSLMVALMAACTSAATPRGEPAPATAAVADSLSSIRLRNLGEGLRLMQRAYPPLLRDAGVTGEVMAELALNADGTVQNVRVNRATHDLFRAPAAEVAERLWFSPPAAAGWPVRVRMKWEIHGGAIQVVSR